MKMDAREVAGRVKHFEEVCRERGIKLTHQRLEIFKEVAQTIDHPDAESVYFRVRKRMPTVSLDTIYRTLSLLKELGLIVVLAPTRERARFDANLKHHHHFICTQCGLTRDFYSEQLDQVWLPDTLAEFGSVQTARVEVLGVCRSCGQIGPAD